MKIDEFDLLKMSTGYIQDGLLKKWRYDNPDDSHMDAKLNIKQYSDEPLTPEEMEYILNFDNVVIVDKYSVILHRFSGNLIKYS